ncbi:SMP-30/gluconolactonase/LRE family protein [Actinomycetospora corticicola]|uniref:DNA-binding beta-propeller fold protein YncE n=1 Tax=Actinomycetospora corticicola TaxID=663602 RepID=A0A7Y9DT99_9PSEU|nr:hypothetical protein [Actinomycetospora corticicola]NYD35101.1 DNA-binding beta-propeller fold protein YncE [Actinomycetospora corticicola]
MSRAAQSRPSTGVRGAPCPLLPGVVPTELVPARPAWAAEALAVAPDGRLWAAHPLAGTVSVLDPATGDVEVVLGPEGPLTAPVALALAADGACFVVDGPPGLVWRCSPGGTTCLVADGLLAPGGIAVLGGRLVVGETGPHGRLLEVLPDGGSREIAAGLDVGGTLGVSPDGRVLVPGPAGAVRAVDPDGRAERLCDGLEDPVAARVDPAGRTLVLTGDGAVHVDGEVVPTGLTGADDLAIGPDGTWYVSGRGTGELVALAPDRSRRQVLPPGLSGPGGLAVLGGRLYAVDHQTLVEVVDGGFRLLGVGASTWRGLAAVGDELLATTVDGELHAMTPGVTSRRLVAGLERPAGLVAVAGEVLVAESGADRVVRAGRAGEVDPVASGFGRPTDLTTADGEVWVTDAERGQVVRLSDGLVVAAGLARPEGLVAHGAALYVVEAAAGRLTRVDPRTRTATPVVGNLPLASLPPHVPERGYAVGPQRPAPYAALAVHDGGLVVGLTGTGSVLRCALRR